MGMGQGRGEQSGSRRPRRRRFLQCGTGNRVQPQVFKSPVAASAHGMEVGDCPGDPAPARPRTTMIQVARAAGLAPCGSFPVPPRRRCRPVTCRLRRAPDEGPARPDPAPCRWRGTRECRGCGDRPIVVRRWKSGGLLMAPGAALLGMQTAGRPCPQSTQTLPHGSVVRWTPIFTRGPGPVAVSRSCLGAGHRCAGRPRGHVPGRCGRGPGFRARGMAGCREGASARRTCRSAACKRASRSGRVAACCAVAQHSACAVQRRVSGRLPVQR